MKPKERARWETIRKRGRKRYIWVNGVAAYGIPMFVVMTFFVNKPKDGNFTVLGVALSALLWLAGGGFFGFATWFLAERRYQKDRRPE